MPRHIERVLWLVVVLLLTLVEPVIADPRSEAKAQVAFGILVAQKGLWNEAVFRWEKAIAIDPTYAAAWNNLGIGYEQFGRFEEARNAYEKALVLDPGDMFIRTNYELFREIYDRQNVRRRQANGAPKPPAKPR